MTNSPESLEKLNPQNPVHFIGIGGCGMSGVARCLRALGYQVSGSDQQESDALETMREAGIQIALGHNGGNLPAGCQLVVVSAAVPSTNPEYMAAQARSIPIIKYAQMLGLLMAQKRGIAVAGTHGKTTTSSMLALALRELGADPSFVIGGQVPQLGGGSGVGESDFLVAEACEFDRSFLSLFPQYALLNNIEEDHLDYYRDLEEILGAFRDFIKRLPPEGLLVYSASSPNIAKILEDAPCRAIGCALEKDAEYRADEIRYTDGKSHYLLRAKTRVGDGPEQDWQCQVSLNTFGRHNVINSLGAIALLHQLGFPLEDAARAVGLCKGARRRFDMLYEGKGICVVDDYAHHPTEIQTVLKSSRVYFEKRRLVAVFQPHQHSRTRFLLKDFARSFQYADLVVIPDIYFVRDSEREKKMIHARDLVRAVLAQGGNAIYIPSFDEIESFLKNNLDQGDVLLTMGAGNIWQVGARLAEYFQEKESL